MRIIMAGAELQNIFSDLLMYEAEVKSVTMLLAKIWWAGAQDQSYFINSSAMNHMAVCVHVKI